MTKGPSLRVAVLGCGKIGSTFAFQLARAGHQVSVIARPGSTRFQQLRRDGAIVDVNGERAVVQVAHALDEQVAYDVVIVTILAYQVAAVMPALKASRAENILFMFNTFEPERLQTAVAAERCAFGMPFVQAMLDGNGRLSATIGSGGQKTLLSEQRWVDLFAAAGLPAALEPDMPLWLRCHAPMCVAFESVSVAAMRRGGGASWREARTLARGVHVSFRLIEALGYSIYPRSKKLFYRAPVRALTAMLWSMSRVRPFREVLATGKVECEALVDAMVRASASVESAVRVRDIEAMKPPL